MQAKYTLQNRTIEHTILQLNSDDPKTKTIISDVCAEIQQACSQLYTTAWTSGKRKDCSQGARRGFVFQAGVSMVVLLRCL